MANLAVRKALWALDNSAWRDIDQVTTLRDSIVKWQDDKPDPDDSEAKSRAELLKDLQETIANLPTLPDASSVALTNEVQQLLQPSERELGYALLADHFVAMLSLPIDHADGFADGGKGLTFKSSELTANATTAWEKTNMLLQSWDDLDVSAARDIVASEQPLRQAALEEKQSLRPDVTSDPVKLRQFRRLELEFQYHDTRIRWAEKTLNDHAKEQSKGSGATD